MRPWMVPSSMNGIRMNQLVAPTSFMTSISWRRAPMAVKTVLRMSSADTPTSTTAAISSAWLTRVEKSSIWRMASVAVATSRTPGWAENWRASSLTLAAERSVGTIRYDGGMTSGVTLSTSSGLSAKRVSNSS